MKTEIARAIRVLQDATGCRVLLEPIMGNEMPSVVAKTSSESVSEPVKAEAVAPEKPAKKGRKAKKEVKEETITFMTAREFANMKGVAPWTIYDAIKKGKIAREHVQRGTNNSYKIDSRAFATFVPEEHHGAKRVSCIETKQEFPSMLAASKALNVKWHQVQYGVKTGKKVGGYHFQAI